MKKVILVVMAAAFSVACGNNNNSGTTPAGSDSVPAGTDTFNTAPAGGSPTMGTGVPPGHGTPADSLGRNRTDTSGR